MGCETKGTDSGEPEQNPDRVDAEQVYVDQLPDITDLFNRASPSQSLQQYGNPPSIDGEEGAKI